MSAWLKKLTDRRLLVAAGLLGIALLALPELIPRRTAAEATTPAVTATAIEQALEQRVSDLLAQVAGVGSCRVMVTLERGEQTLYATDTAGTDSTVVFVDTADGPVGLPLATLTPAVKGVAVVCDGGGDETVRQQVTQLIATAFHISDRRVCVAQLK